MAGRWGSSPLRLEEAVPIQSLACQPALIRCTRCRAPRGALQAQIHRQRMRLGVPAEAADEQDGDVVRADAERLRAAPRRSRPPAGSARSRRPSGMTGSSGRGSAGPQRSPSYAASSASRASTWQDRSRGADQRVPRLDRPGQQLAELSIAPGWRWCG